MHGHHFLNITPVAQTLRATINKWYLLKMSSFYKAKDILTKTKCWPTDWAKVFTNPTSDRGLVSKIYKEFKRLNIKLPNILIKKNIAQI